MRPGRDDPSQTLAIEIAVTRKNLEAIRAVDPQAVLFTNSWTLLDRRRQAAALRAILDSQERLLSTSDEFCLSPILARAWALPHAPDDIEERIRDILTVWAGKILDDAHRDDYELVRFYYRKRVEAFLAQAEANLTAGRAIVDDRQLEPVYREIEQGFVRTPFVVAKGDRSAGTPVQAVREVVARHRLTEAELKGLAASATAP